MPEETKQVSQDDLKKVFYDVLKDNSDPTPADMMKEFEKLQIKVRSQARLISF